MRLFFHEGKKIYKNRGLIGLTLLLFACNLFFAFWSVDHAGDTYSPRWEAQLLREAEKEQAEDLTEWLEKKQEELHATLRQMVELGKQQGKIQEEDRLLRLMEESDFLARMQSLSQNNDEYKETLAALCCPNRGIAASSLVSDHAYYQMLQEKIGEMYGSLPQRDLPLLPSGGMEILAGFSFTDAILLLLAFVLVMQVVSQEYNGGMMRLIRYTKRGYLGLFFAKLLMLLTLVVSLGTLFYGGSFLGIRLRIGFPDFAQPIQAVGEYLLCPYELSVGQFLLLCWLWKTMGLLLWTMICFLLALLLHRNVWLSGAALGVLAEQFFLWDRIDYGMWYGLWKDGSIFSMLTPRHYYSEAVCVNLAGRPVEISVTGGMFFAMIFLIVFCASLFIWKKNTSVRVARLIPRKYPRRKYRVHEKLEFFEARRLVWMCGAGILLCLSVAANFALNRSGRLYSDTEGYYQNYCSRLEGETPKQVDVILREEADSMEETQRILEDYERRYAAGEISSDAFLAIQKYYEIPDGRKQAYQTVVTQVDTVKSRFAPEETYGIFYETGWKKILGEGILKRMIADLLVFLALGLLGIAQRETMEYQYHMQPLLVTKQRGKKEYRNAERKTAAVLGALGMAFVWAARIAAVNMDYTIYGENSLFLPVKSLSFREMPGLLAELPLAIALPAIMVTEALLGAALVLLASEVSCRRKHPVNAIFVSVILIIFPLAFVFFLL